MKTLYSLFSGSFIKRFVFGLLFSGFSLLNYASAQNTQSSTVGNPKIEISKQENPNLKSTVELPSDPQHPMYGLNLYVPAHDVDYQTNTDWYGSGDVNGDGIIDMDDYNSSITGSDPFNDGTYRGDTNLDGVSGEANDKAIILEYINGERTHINKWELETEAEKRNHFSRAMAIDPTDKVNPSIADWVCYNFSGQTFLNFAGIYEIENSSFAQDNTTNLQYDLSHNGIFRIPLRDVSTLYYESSGPHSINNVFLGSPENQDATAFSSRLYIEPQTDVIKQVGDNSFNKYAKESWYGYYNNLYFGWKYGSIGLINYDLNITPPTSSNIFPSLVISWNPFHDLEYPADQNQEYTPGIEDNLETGEISNFIYANETQIKKTITSGQINNGSKNQYNYDVNVLWELTAGAYNSQNTVDAIHNQTLRIRDTTPPVYNEATGEWSDSSGGPVSVLEERVVTGDICKSDTTITQTGTDVSGNKAEYIKEIIGEPYTGTPYLVSDPHEGDTLRIALETQEIPENIGGWPEYKDDKTDITIDYTIEELAWNGTEWLKKMTFTATNECGNISLDIVTRYYIKPSAVGINKGFDLTNLNIYPNPSHNDVTIDFGKPYTSIRIQVKNLLGQNLMEKRFSSTQKIMLQMPIQQGMYLLVIEADGLKTTKFVVRQPENE